MNKITAFTLIHLFGLIGCSTSSSKPDLSESNPTFSHSDSKESLHSFQSSIDIQYILGKDHYRFITLAQGKEITAHTYLNKQVIEKGKIDGSRYPDYLKKVELFIYETLKHPVDDSMCRSPFTIILTIGKETQTARGCRSTNGGALSKLVRDGEFLLYSKF